MRKEKEKGEKGKEEKVRPSPLTSP